MKIFSLLSLVLSFSFSAFAVPLKRLTYGQAAANLTLQKLEAAYVAIETVTENSLPDETKETRKQILAAREMLDLFAYSFEAGKNYEKIRQTLDDGYEAIGHFKDLYDVQAIEDPMDAVYDDQMLIERLDQVLSWKRKFLKSQEDFFKFVQNVRTVGASEHKLKYLSNQFWGISQVQPQADMPAQVAIGFLLQDLWSTAVDEYKIVKKIEDPGKDTENIEVYHDFRKRVRTALKIIQYFDELNALVSAEQIETLSTLVEHYGKISDLIAKVEQLTEKDKNKKAHAVHKEIKDKWTEVQAWEAEQNIKNVLKSMTFINFTHSSDHE